MSGRYLSVCSAPVLISFLFTLIGALSCFGLDVTQKINVLVIRRKNIDRMYDN
jgi:hypothetical protein